MLFTLCVSHTTARNNVATRRAKWLYQVRVAADTITACNTCLHRRTSRALGLPAIRNASQLFRTAHSSLTRAKPSRAPTQRRTGTFWNAPAQREAPSQLLPREERGPTAGRKRAQSYILRGVSSTHCCSAGRLRERFLPSVM